MGVALIGGFLAWLNRRGGCTSRSREKRTTDFEDFGLAETDFPHHRSPPMAASNLAAAGAGAGAAAAGGAAVAGAASPTLPRLNEQGNFYNDAPSAEYGTNRHYVPSYQQPYGAPPGGPMSPGQQHQQQPGYYYPESGYYDDQQQYYYDGSTAVSSQGYDHQQPQPQHMYDAGSAAAQRGGDYYKPDTADGKPHQRM